MRIAAAEGEGKEEQSECEYKGRLGQRNTTNTTTEG